MTVSPNLPDQSLTDWERRLEETTERLEALLNALPVGIDIIDIRDKKKAEAANLKREKPQTVVEMAGAVCHEFNQPLQVLSGYCDILKHLPELGDEWRGAVNSMAKEIRRMGDLTKKLTHITEYRTKPYLKSRIFDIKSSSGNGQP